MDLKYYSVLHKMQMLNDYFMRQYESILRLGDRKFIIFPSPSCSRWLMCYVERSGSLEIHGEAWGKMNKIIITLPYNYTSILNPYKNPLDVFGSYPHSNHVTSSKGVDTLICHTTMRRNSINFLYNPGHVTLWCL